MPTKPRLVKPADTPRFKTWDEYVEEATTGVEPFRLPVSAEEELEIECPTGDDLVAVGEAQRTQDMAALAVAVFGDHAGRILQLAGPRPFTIINRLVNDVMAHYNLLAQQGAGRQEDLGES